MAFRILHLFDDCCAPIWDKLNHYKATGQLPKPIVVEEKKAVDYSTLSAIELLKARNNLRTYVSKAKRGLKPSEYIPGWEKEIETINQLLNVEK